MTRRLNSHFAPFSAVLALVATAFAAPAGAGEYFEQDGLALRGYDPVAYFSEGEPAPGKAEHTAEYEGSTFRFASQSNRDLFAADPARYAPEYGGFCAFGTANGYKAATDPAAFTIVKDKLYLNYNGDVQKQWRADTRGFIGKADANWPAVIDQTDVYQ